MVFAFIYDLVICINISGNQSGLKMFLPKRRFQLFPILPIMVRQIRERGYTVQICNLTLMYPIFVMTIKFSLDSTWEVFHRDFGGFDQR